MSIVVFWINDDAGRPFCQHYEDTNLGEALKLTETLRSHPQNRHVCISSELGDMIGKAGVSAVENGKTPDGHDYEWSKQHRGAGPRKEEP